MCLIPWWGGALCHSDTAGHLSPLPCTYDSREQNIWRCRLKRCLCTVGKGQHQAVCDRGLDWLLAGTRRVMRRLTLAWDGTLVSGAELGRCSVRMTFTPQHPTTTAPREPKCVQRIQTRNQPGFTWTCLGWLDSCWKMQATSWSNFSHRGSTQLFRTY